MMTMVDARPCVRARGVTKRYGDVTALADVDLDIRPASIVGLLGPNGAGKTTLLEILCGLRAPDEGSVEVLGLDPHVRRQELAFRVGVQTQDFGLPSAVRTREALLLFAKLYPRSLDVDELLSQFDLTAKARARFRQLSGGQRRRLALARALIGDPQMVILDEPTTALDPQGRDFLRERIRSLRDQGRSVVLSTHDIADAELLCDEIVILDAGRVVSKGSAGELVERHAASSVVRFRSNREVVLPDGAVASHYGGDRVVFLYDPGPIIEQLGGGASSDLVELRHATLEDVFLLLTGRDLRG
jgi:ABC-2 type transport system ATP-binding protein